jgi:hypothetical protein
VRRAISIFSVLVALSTSACGGGSSGVSAATYVGKVCTAVAAWARDIQNRSGVLTTVASAGPTQSKAALQTFMTAAVSDTGTVVSQLRSAGVPNISGGSQIASQLISGFKGIESAIAQAASSAKSLPTGDPTSFNTARRALALSVRSSLGSISTGLAALKNPDLEAASKKVPACVLLGAA